jgi:hypothetical protein
MSEQDILQHIISHSLERAGGGEKSAEIDAKQILAYIAEGKAAGYNRSRHHDQLVRGAIITNVSIGSIEGTVQRCATARKFICEHESKHGTDPLVFIAAELVWSCVNDGDLPYRLFSTTCAVNSIIGLRKMPVLIRRGMIIARQLGYKTPKVMAAELAANPTARKPFSTQQLRDTLDRIETRDLVARCQASRRNVYFSNSLNREELLEAVKKKIEAKGKVPFRRAIDRETFSKTKQQPNENHLKRKSESEVKKEPLKNEKLQASQTGATTATAGTTTRPTTKTKALKEEPFNQMPLKEKREMSNNSREKRIEEIPNEPPKPEIPSLEAAWDFAKQLPPKGSPPADTKTIQKWLREFTQNPTANWKKSVASRVLAKRKCS